MNHSCPIHVNLRAYREAVESAFGSEVDYAQIVKIYGRDAREEHSYAPPEVTGSEKTINPGQSREQHDLH